MQLHILLTRGVKENETTKFSNKMQEYKIYKEIILLNSYMDKNIPSHEDNTDIMLRFLNENGSATRFDKYMEEHLFGDNGYYNNKVTIGPHGDFITDSNYREFAHIIYLYLKQKKLYSEHFLEIGGGEGTFKNNYLKYDPDTKYISVDISKKLACKQKRMGGKGTIISNINNLPINDNMIEGNIFSNELIDALPCRVFKISKGKREYKIDKEGYVCVDGTSIHFKFEEPDKDYFLFQYEKFLNQKRNIFDLKQRDIISVAPDTEDVLRECCRILKSGKILFIDYGYSEKYVSAKQDAEEMPYYMDYSKYRDVEDIIRKPYDVDITYSIDFNFLEWIANQINSRATVSHQPLRHIVKDVVKQYNPDSVPKKYHDLGKISRRLALEIEITP